MRWWGERVCYTWYLSIWYNTCVDARETWTMIPDWHCVLNAFSLVITPSLLVPGRGLSFVHLFAVCCPPPNDGIFARYQTRPVTTWQEWVMIASKYLSNVMEWWWDWRVFSVCWVRCTRQQENRTTISCTNWGKQDASLDKSLHTHTDKEVEFACGQLLPNECLYIMFLHSSELSRGSYFMFLYF